MASLQRDGGLELNLVRQRLNSLRLQPSARPFSVLAGHLGLAMQLQHCHPGVQPNESPKCLGR